MTRRAATVALALVAAGAAAQLDDYAGRLKAFGEALQQEELFLHLDNSSYRLGDTIYYKAYSRLSGGQPSTLSKMLYVELLNQDGFLVERQKIEMTKGHGFGSFTLGDSLYAGFYEMRAYTRWQLNWGEYQHPHTTYAENWFYNKRMAREYYRDYDKLYSRVFPVFDKPETPGDLAASMTTRPMRRYFRASDNKRRATICFYPEGGCLLNGARCRVAYEAGTDEGQHIEGSLTVTDREGRVVATSRTESRGRGCFTMECVKGEQYTATLHWQGGTATATLPDAQDDGCAITAESSPQGIHIELQTAGAAAGETLGLTASCHGVLMAFREMEGPTMDIPADELRTGVIQLTVFNSEGRVYADRLVFLNKGDLRDNTLFFTGLDNGGYMPYDHISFNVTGPENTTFSLSVRDAEGSVPTFDTANILTEMLLASQIKGFVERPDYFFESDDDTHRRALDLLLLVQGWRRYMWHDMATPGAFTLKHPYERTELLTGEVNRYTPQETENVFAAAGREMTRDAGMDADADAEGDETSRTDDTLPETTTKTNWQMSAERFHNDEGALRNEVTVRAEFVQPGVKNNGMAFGEAQTYNHGAFRIEAPHLYEACILFLAASDTTKRKKGRPFSWTAPNEDSKGNVAYPEFYVKLSPVFPRFTKPYSFYQTSLPDRGPELEKLTGTDDAVMLKEITVGAKRGGLRRFDPSKPALAIDAYQAFNDVCEAGLCPGYYIGASRFCQDIARNYIGDMNMARSYDLEQRFNTKNASALISPGTLEKYNHLSNINMVYIYTDYSPRYEGDKRYAQENQPTVTVDLRRYEDDSQRMAWRDRRMLLTGFAVCEDFYHPDYTNRRPAPDTDYRRTLYWNPNLTLGDTGTTTITLFNNATHSLLHISAEGMTTDGIPVTGSLRQQ